MSKLVEVLEKYGKLYGLVSEEMPMPGADPAMGAAPPAAPAPPPPPAPAGPPAPPAEDAKPSAREDVEKVQDMQDALGIDPSKLMSSDKSVFSDEVTPINAQKKLKKIRQIVQDNKPPTDL